MQCSVDDVPSVFSGVVLAHLPVFIEDLAKGLDEFTQKLDVVATVIFTMINVKGNSESEQQQPGYFSYDHFLDSGWSFCGGIISFVKTIMECYHIECSLSPMRPVGHIISTTEICFQTSLPIGFEVVSSAPCLLKFVQY